MSALLFCFSIMVYRCIERNVTENSTVIEKNSTPEFQTVRLCNLDYSSFLTECIHLIGLVFFCQTRFTNLVGQITTTGGTSHPAKGIEY